MRKYVVLSHFLAIPTPVKGARPFLLAFSILGTAVSIVFSQSTPTKKLFVDTGSSAKSTAQIVAVSTVSCAGPTDKIKVTMKQSGTSYTFTITNSLAQAVNAFSIGYNGSWREADNSKAIPKTIKSPSKWKGFLDVSDKGNEMVVFWHTKKAPITSGATLSGFTIEMPAQDDKLKQVSFEVGYISKGSKCVWGRISQ